MNHNHYTWEQFDRDTDLWLGRIDFSNYDLLLGIAKGGLPLLVKFANRTKKDYDIAKCHSYEDMVQTELKYNLDHTDVKGKRILLIDDIADSGKTLQELVNGLSWKGAISVETLTLFHKPQSVIEPTWYMYEVPNEVWLNFPWE